VPYTHQISKYEVTNAQYAEFLNAVAWIDTNGLYITAMGSGRGGITRDGSPGFYTYSARAGREQMPVNYVSFYDALRFANWLHNDQPTGLQHSTTTEDGAYDMSLGSGVVRKAGAKVFLTSENEWYKAAYFNGTSYFDYPAGSDTQITCAVTGPTPNTANCDLVVFELTDVGSYTGSPSPYGTFDQGGNVSEWNEAHGSSLSGYRGGTFLSYPTSLASSHRSVDSPVSQLSLLGFRVASIPGGWFPTCGDGLIEGGERCDDGGTTPGDGCDASCQIEDGWICAGEPSVCTEYRIPALPKWGYVALAGGLIVVGAVVMRRRAARPRRGNYP
jgi:cysteine-rich repeat protein